MPTIIAMQMIREAGKNLCKGVSLPGSVKVQMFGSKMVMAVKKEEVFHMRMVKVIDRTLWIDYPKTAKGQEGRGWGILGMLIALYYGKSQNCSNVELNTAIEADSIKFWAKFGIGTKTGTTVENGLTKGFIWVLGNCPQRLNQPTEFVLRDPRQTLGLWG